MTGPGYRDERLTHDGAASGLPTGVAPDQSRVVLLVLRLDLDPGGTDAASLFINPIGPGELAAPIQQVSGEFIFNELQLPWAS